MYAIFTANTYDIKNIHTCIQHVHVYSTCLVCTSSLLLETCSHWKFEQLPIKSQFQHEKLLHVKPITFKQARVMWPSSLQQTSCMQHPFCQQHISQTNSQHEHFLLHIPRQFFFLQGGHSLKHGKSWSQTCVSLSFSTNSILSLSLLSTRAKA